MPVRTRTQACLLLVIAGTATRETTPTPTVRARARTRANGTAKGLGVARARRRAAPRSAATAAPTITSRRRAIDVVAQKGFDKSLFKNTTNFNETQDSRSPPSRRQACLYCFSLEHEVEQCPKAMCQRCRKLGHTEKRCPLPCSLCGKTGSAQLTC